MTEQAATSATDKKPQGQFALQRIYVKDLSFESPNAPALFTQEWNPETKLNFNSSARKQGDNLYEVVLALNVTVTLGGKTAFIAEIKQAGLFTIEAPEGMLEPILGAHCPNILFPFARETIADLVTRGTFPQLLLQPMNFEAVYLEAKRRREEQAGAATEAKH